MNDEQVNSVIYYLSEQKMTLSMDELSSFYANDKDAITDIPELINELLSLDLIDNLEGKYSLKRSVKNSLVICLMIIKIILTDILSLKNRRKMRMSKIKNGMI